MLSCSKNICQLSKIKRKLCIFFRVFMYSLFISQHDYMKEEGFPEDEATESEKNLKFGERVGCLSKGS